MPEPVVAESLQGAEQAGPTHCGQFVGQRRVRCGFGVPLPPAVGVAAQPGPGSRPGGQFVGVAGVDLLQVVAVLGRARPEAVLGEKPVQGRPPATSLGFVLASHVWRAPRVYEAEERGRK
ncbi:hypothetical protein [Amycolatopsis circi]|uniref:hypothetical protein n=1 Tax=Amycolatopsis circi TaxID=871959 RepID=UPI001FCA08A8|nr:hypothetical protein [Amycolatopsis circi]